MSRHLCRSLLSIATSTGSSIAGLRCRVGGVLFSQSGQQRRQLLFAVSSTGLPHHRASSSYSIGNTTAVIDEELKASIRDFDAMTPHPMNLQQILTVSVSSETIKELNEFLRQEFSIRCAERICMLEERIPNFAEIPELQRVYTKHIESFVQMRRHDPSRDDFLPVVRAIVERGHDIVSLLCRGMAKRLVQQSDSSNADDDNNNDNTADEAGINTFMNEFLLNRIGSNVLMSQYLAVATGDDPPHPTSIIDPHCDVTKICRETARSVTSLCYAETGFRPTIKVDASYVQDDDGGFAFIPPVITYITQELLKNSAVATARHKKHRKSKSTDDLGISVIVCADERRVMIHIGDRAGGIPFETAPHVWSYLYSTKQRQQQQEEPHDDDRVGASLEAAGATDLGGYGVGLPLSRLYASYLGGTINLISLPGYGTHAYVFLPRLPEAMVERVPVRATGWQANARATSHSCHFIM